jgi:hypothetical protein
MNATQLYSLLNEGIEHFFTPKTFLFSFKRLNNIKKTPYKKTSHLLTVPKQSLLFH